MPSEIIFIVEDDPTTQEVMGAQLNGIARSEGFLSAEECHRRLSEQVPDLILLDIELPGMDGHAFCRLIKEDPETRHVPVIFVSSHDTPDERLASYDVGGHDFIIKPFDPKELLKKVEVALRLVGERKDYRQQLSSADELTSLVLASMDEAGIVLQFMSKLIGYQNYQEIAQGFLELLGRIGINGAVQVRVGKREVTVGKEGWNVPLEVSVCNHLKTLDRIFEFKRRVAFNYEHVTVLIHEMPNDDAACGRIRDNVTIAAQAADSRLAALTVAEARDTERMLLLETLEALSGTFVGFRNSHEQQRLISSELVFDIERDLAKAFCHLGLSVSQERFLEDMLKSRLSELLVLVDKSDELEEILSGLIERLDMLTHRRHH